MGGELDDVVSNNLERMQIHNTTYLPHHKHFPNIVPTEYSVERERVIRGEVHDPTAYLFGGVAGHAGIFSVAADLLQYMQVHLNKGRTVAGKRVYSEEVVELFYTRVDGLPYDNRRALGWDTVPIQPHPPCGNKFSLNSFGHTGYTGTMMWADRDKNLIIIFLTNRVHPTSLSEQILQARMDVSDTIVDILS
jgi:CubicO group peptidase (beta-lactamase class C family)